MFRSFVQSIVYGYFTECDFPDKSSLALLFLGVIFSPLNIKEIIVVWLRETN